MKVSDIYETLSLYFRKRRMREFESRFLVNDSTRILDLGGTTFNWELIKSKPSITIVNILEPPENMPSNINWIKGDAIELMKDSKDFDICFSNSVIEHVGSHEHGLENFISRQKQFASCIRNAAENYYVQTPNYWFPIEPHLLTPFIHWLPVGFQINIARYFSFWGLLARPDKETIETFINEICLLDKNRFRNLFPDSELIIERFFGLPKSFIAIKKQSI